MMKRIILSIVVMLALTTAAKAEEKVFFQFKVLTPEVALELALATLKSCRKAGYQTAVVVVDRFGNTQVALRDQLAGAHTVDTARRKAWTAVSFRTDTMEMTRVSQAGQPQSGVRQVTNALMIGGGVPVTAAGSIVAGIGVSGAPGGEADDKCARDGIEAITDKLEF